MNSNQYINEQQFLTAEQLEQITIDVIRSFDIELARLTLESRMQETLEWAISFYTNRDIFSFFNLQNLLNLADEVFMNDKRRAFVLNLTERSMMTWCTTELQYDSKFVNTLVKWISYNKVSWSPSRNSFINKEVQEAIQVNPDVLRSHLLDNPWVTILFLLFVNFNRSSVYQELQRKQVQSK